MIGDSVQASFGFAPQATRRLGRGIDLRVDARVCRRLTTASCSGGGAGTPENALALVRRLGPALGPVVVMNVGYNDDPAAFDIDSMLAALRSAGVRSVIWVTLREQRSSYSTINARIRDRASRRPWMSVADWNAYSAGKPWFAGDGLHLTSGGAYALAGLLRDEVGKGLAQIGISIDGRSPTRQTREVSAPRAGADIAGDQRALWVSDARTLRRRDPESGRPLAGSQRLGAGDRLISDGLGSWLVSGNQTTIAPLSGREADPIGPVIDVSGPAPRLARAGDRLWVATRCAAGDDGCLDSRGLSSFDLPAGSRTRAALEGPVIALAASPRALWTTIGPSASARRVLELRHAQTGQVRRSIPVAFSARSMAATRGGVWITTFDGRLLTTRPKGAVRRVQRGVAAVISDGADELWVLRADRRTLQRLDPRNGRVLVSARSGSRLSASRDHMAMTGTRLWIAGERESVIVSVALGAASTR
ncbi:hypothetical protein [Miltoncostaea oceani]|uniref:hypothetical protein n=1 Tax=Miltoncostaea oceani TaxID=2843216 RepID=UPI001C3DA006|nr:hypothetical protein [Miltoncostaea oceani]